VQVLDVDGNVISSEELVRRVEQHLTTIGPTSMRSRDGVAGRRTAPSTGLNEAPLRGLWALQARTRPPDLGQPKGLKGRASKFAKRIVRKLTHWYVEPRWTVQQAYNLQNAEFASSVLAELRLQNARFELQAASFAEQLERSRWQGRDGFAMQDDVQLLRQEVAVVLERLGMASASGADIDYPAFEELFRGSSVEIGVSQERYLTKLLPPDVAGLVVDIGCGRGEMLELLRNEGHDVLGVDTNSGMIEVCIGKGLPVVQDDGIHLLEQMEDKSLKGIFCLQVIEHLLTSELEKLISIAQQKLLVGGVLVMETINPRSSFSLGNHFFADTSHVRPVHPETLRFICQESGFGHVALVELSPHPLLKLVDDLPEEGTVSTAVEALLTNVFGFQDYAIIATR
jgi:2-polyprenyl-3-methyl-5-hydroxy-6-metoxy-1,4-benzoquinol methylase